MCTDTLLFIAPGTSLLIVLREWLIFLKCGLLLNHAVAGVLKLYEVLRMYVQLN